MKRVLSVFLVFILLSNTVVYAEVVHSSEEINGASLELVSIDPKTANFDVVTAGDKVVGLDSFTNLVKESQADAAINANFFTFATGFSCGNLVKDGKIIYLEGNEKPNPSFFVDSRGRGHAENIGLSLDFQISSSEGSESYSCHNVNNELKADNKIYVFTKERGQSVQLDRGLLIRESEGIIREVKEVEETEVFEIGPEESLVFFRGRELRPSDLVSPGHSLNYSQGLFNSSFNKNNPDLTIDHLVSANPLILEDGKNLVKGYSYKATRSALGVTDQGHIKMVYQENIGLDQLAENLKELGCVSAVNLDGGGSSALYANGEFIKNTDRKINSVFVAYSTVPPKPENNYDHIKDLPKKGYWSRKALEYSIDENLMEGFKGNIRPDDPITRAEVATMMTKLLSLEKYGNLTSFTDLSEDKWYWDSISKAYAAGILVGSDNLIRPNDYISREESFSVLARVLKISEDKNHVASFKDHKEISSWALKSTNALVKNGYVSGYNNKLRPKDNISRAEFAQILYAMDIVELIEK